MYTLKYTSRDGSTTITKGMGSDLAGNWGFDKNWKVSFKDQEPDEMTLSMPRSALAIAQFEYLSTCIVYCDAGTPVFQGVLTTDPRSCDPRKQSIELTWSGPWWYLEATPYELQFPLAYNADGAIKTYQYLSHFVLNQTYNPSVGFVFSATQVKAALDYCIGKCLIGFPVTTFPPFQYVGCGFPQAIAGGTVFVSGTSNTGIVDTTPGFYLGMGPVQGGSTIFPDASKTDLLDVPVIPRVAMNMTCAEVIKKQYEDYNVVCFFDHSTVPPTFRVKPRNPPNYTGTATPNDPLDLTTPYTPVNAAVVNAEPNHGACVAVTRPMGPISGQYYPSVISTQDLRQRYDREVSFVQITFEQTISINGASVDTQVVDFWAGPVYQKSRPTGPGQSFNPLIVAVPLSAISTVSQNQYLQTIPIVGPTGPIPGSEVPGTNGATTYGPAEDINFWMAVKPELANTTEYQNPSIVPGSSTRKYGGVYTDAVLRGSVCSWMGGVSAKDEITALFSYTAKNKKQAPAQLIHVTKTVTSLSNPNGGILSALSTTGGETAYLGMARMIYNDLNTPDWDGKVVIYDPSWLNSLTIGNLLNLTNGYMGTDGVSGWSTMNAIVREITWSFGQGGVYGHVTLGPNKKLTPGNIRDKYLAWKLKYMTPPAISGSTGIGVTEVDLPIDTAIQSVSEAPANYVKDVVGNTDVPINPGEASVVAQPSIPTQPFTTTQTAQGQTAQSTHGVIQKAVSAPSGEEAGIWGNSKLITKLNAAGYADAGLFVYIGDVNGSPIQVTGQQVDSSGNPIGPIGGQILMLLSQLFGQNASFMPTLACDSAGNTLYGFVLRTAWSTTPVAGVTYS